MCEFDPHDWIFYTNGSCCASNNEPFEIAEWIGDMCNGTWRSLFDYYGGMARLDWEEWIEPWNWTVRAESPTTSKLPPLEPPDCPTSALKLGLLLLENLVTALSGIVWEFIFYKLEDSTGPGAEDTRPPRGKIERMWRVIKRSKIGWLFPSQTRGRTRRRRWPPQLSNPGWKEAMWFRLTGGRIGRVDDWLFVILGIASAVWDIGSNFANAFILKAFPGYESVPGVELAMLWCTRPRFNYLACVLALLIDHEPFADIAASFAITEIFLQIFAFYSIFTTVNVGRQRNFYLVHHLNPFWRGDPAYAMYVGALMWIIVVLLFVIVLVFVVFIMRSFIRWSQENAARMEEALRRRKERAEQQREQQSEEFVIGVINLTLLGLNAIFHLHDNEANPGQYQRLHQPDDSRVAMNNDAGSKSEADTMTNEDANRFQTRRPLEDNPAPIAERYPYKWRKYSLTIMLLIAVFANFAQWAFWVGFVLSEGSR